MDFSTYQKLARETADYPNAGNNIDYPVLGLCGEAGEVANKVKKIQRDDKGILTESRRRQIVEELGDTLWYIAAICDEMKITLNGVAHRNLEKLNNRVENNTLHGEGDER